MSEITTATTTPTTPTTTNDRVYIFDTTLRDGEQSAGASMTIAEKLEVADALSRLGVDIIEAGFPIASPGDLDAVRQIARRVKGSVVCGLARALKPDIEAAWEALRDAEEPRIHTFVSTSAIHLQHQIRKSPEQVLAMAAEAVRYAKSFVSNVEFSAMDATRSEPDYMAQVFSAAIAAGATTLNVPDTLGYTTPEEHAALFRYLMAHTDGAEKVIWSSHCHNDLGPRHCEHTGGNRRGCAAGRGDDQRHRRAGGEHLFGGDRDGPAHAARPVREPRYPCALGISCQHVTHRLACK